MRKIVAVLGIVAVLFVVEGLLRFGSFVGVLGTALEEPNDYAIYMIFCIIYVVISGLLLVSIFREFQGIKAGILKYAIFVLGLGCLGLMLAAPAFPVVAQIMGGMTVSLFALLCIKVESTRTEAELNNEEHAEAPSRMAAKRIDVSEKSTRLSSFLKVGLGLTVVGIIMLVLVQNFEQTGGGSSYVAAPELAVDSRTEAAVYDLNYEVGDVITLDQLLVRIDKVQMSEILGSDVLSSRAGSGATYLIVEYSFQNNSNRQLSPMDAPDIIIRDVDENWFAPSPNPTDLARAHWLANGSYSRGLYTGDPINPDITYHDVLVFELNEENLRSAGWKLFPAVGGKEAPVRFMKEPGNVFSYPNYFGVVGTETHTPAGAANLAAELYTESLYRGASCCEVTGVEPLEASGIFSCPANISGSYFEFGYATYVKGQSFGEGDVHDARFGICVPSVFDSLADLIVVHDGLDGIQTRGLSLQLEEAYIYYAIQE